MITSSDPNDAGAYLVPDGQHVLKGPRCWFCSNTYARAKEQKPRVPIPNAEWSFSGCPQGGGNRTVNL
jgi:hypothetical protein